MTASSTQIEPGFLSGADRMGQWQPLRDRLHHIAERLGRRPASGQQEHREEECQAQPLRRVAAWQDGS